MKSTFPAALVAAIATPGLALAHVSLGVPAALGGAYYVGDFVSDMGAERRRQSL